MKQRLLLLRETLQTSIWFIPAMFCLYGLVLATLLLAWEPALRSSIPGLERWVMPVSSARQVLGVIASSVLSVGGVVFSVTMVALTLTSGQYGPKVLRQFLSDNRSKVSLGLFMGTSLYCLVTLSGYEDADEPSATVLVALVLTVLALASFIQFIHGTATDLQADKIIERIGNDLSGILSDLSREEQLQAHSNDILAWRREARDKRAVVIAGLDSGYVQTIDYPGILQWCAELGCVAQLRVRAGDFVLPGDTLFKLYGCEPELIAARLDELRSLLHTGQMRTPVQDPEYPITQLNQLAARALSPGINDPGTAITCIDWFGLAIARIVDRDLPGKVLLDAHGQAAVLIRFTDFSGILKAFYAPARQFAQGNIPVLISLLDSLIRLAKLTHRPDRLRELATHGQQISHTVEQGNHREYDLRSFRQRHNKLQRLTTAVSGAETLSPD